MKTNRAVITAHLLVHDDRVLNFKMASVLHLTLTNQEIVDAPAMIDFPEIEPSIPVRILNSIGIEMPISIDETIIKKLTERLPFF